MLEDVRGNDAVEEGLGDLRQRGLNGCVPDAVQTLGSALSCFTHNLDPIDGSALTKLDLLTEPPRTTSDVENASRIGGHDFEDFRPRAIIIFTLVHIAPPLTHASGARTAHRRSRVILGGVVTLPRFASPWRPRPERMSGSCRISVSG